MRKVLAMTHVAFEDLGTLGVLLTQTGFEIEIVDACLTDLRAVDPLKPDLMVVLGGPIGVYEREAYPFIDAEIDLIRTRLVNQRPTVGICLGAQLMAAALGARVYPGTQGKEIGWAPLQAGKDIALYPGFADWVSPGLRVLHWHGDTFDLPAKAHHLAGTAAYPNQAFALGRYGLGLQFHSEVTAQGLERWYVGHACELGNAHISVPQLREDSRTFAPRLESVARSFWRNWLAEALEPTNVEDRI